jgi:serine/threonine protein kinase
MPDLQGQRFGNYQLIRLLGESASAQVYLGEHVLLKTQDTIKVLRGPIEDEKIELFRSTASSIAKMEHPCIARLLDFGVEKNIPFLVTEYAPNGTLRQKHPAGTPLPLALTVRYVQQVAEALEYAHKQRIIHRDVKPENMLLGHKNEVLLSDFAIPIVSHQAYSATTQESVESIWYIAPEQLRRKPHPSSDQYALAVVAYEWLTGRLPFQGTFLEVAQQHLEVPPPPMREPGSAFSADVERVIRRGLEKHWQMRYASARHFANALHDSTFPPTLPFTRYEE